MLSRIKDSVDRAGHSEPSKHAKAHTPSSTELSSPAQSRTSSIAPMDGAVDATAALKPMLLSISSMVRADSSIWNLITHTWRLKVPASLTPLRE